MKPPRAGGLHDIAKNGSNVLKGQYEMLNQFGIQNRAMSNSLQQQQSYKEESNDQIQVRIRGKNNFV